MSEGHAPGLADGGSPTTNPVSIRHFEVDWITVEALALECSAAGATDRPHWIG
jgi:hypothetical protein